MLILKVIAIAEWKGSILDPRPFWPCKKGSGEKTLHGTVLIHVAGMLLLVLMKACQLNKQGVVTYMLSVEAFATGIKIFDRQKVCLIT